MVQLHKDEQNYSGAIDPVLDSFDPYRIPLETNYPPDPYQNASSPYGQPAGTPRTPSGSSYSYGDSYRSYPADNSCPEDPYSAPLPTVNLQKPPTVMTGVYPDRQAGSQNPYVTVQPTYTYQSSNQPYYPPQIQYPGKSKATASIVVSIIGYFELGIIGLILGIVGIYLSNTSKKESIAAGWYPCKEANTGFTLSIIVLVLSGLLTAALGITYLFSLFG